MGEVMGAITPIHVTRCGDVVLGREIEAIEQLDEAAQEARYQAEQDLTFDEVLEEIAESFTKRERCCIGSARRHSRASSRR
jgi:hypothetical protein